MTTTVNAYAAARAGTPFEPFHYDLPEMEEYLDKLDILELKANLASSSK